MNLKKFKIPIIIVLVTLLSVVVYAATRTWAPLQMPSSAAKATNVVGFDMKYIQDNPELKYRFGISQLALDNTAQWFHKTGTDGVSHQFNIGDDNWNQNINDYISNHYVGIDGDSYWLGSYDTVDYKGNIIHAINKSTTEGTKLSKLFNDLIKNGTKHVKSEDGGDYLQFQLTPEQCRVFYDYVCKEYDTMRYSNTKDTDGNWVPTRDPYTYGLFQQLRHYIDTNDVDVPIVFVVEVQAPVTGDGVASAQSVDGATVTDPEYSYWASPYDMYVRCGGNPERLRSQSAYVTKFMRSYGATDTDSLLAYYAGYVRGVKNETTGDTLPHGTNKGTNWPYRWTEYFYKNCYADNIASFKKQGAMLSTAIRDNVVKNSNTKLDAKHTSGKDHDYDGMSDFAVGIILADYNGTASYAGNKLYASVDRSNYSANVNHPYTDEIPYAAVQIVPQTNGDIMAWTTANLYKGTKYNLSNLASTTGKASYTSSAFLDLLLHDNIVKFAVNTSTKKTDVNIQWGTTDNIKTSFPYTAHDTSDLKVGVYESQIAPASAKIFPAQYKASNDPNKRADGSHDEESTIIESAIEQTQLANINIQDPIETTMNVSLATGAQLYKVRLKYAYHIDNYKHKIRLQAKEVKNYSFYNFNCFPPINPDVDGAESPMSWINPYTEGKDDYIYASTIDGLKAEYKNSTTKALNELSSLINGSYPSRSKDYINDLKAQGYNTSQFVFFNKGDTWTADSNYNKVSVQFGTGTSDGVNMTYTVKNNVRTTNNDFTSTIGAYKTAANTVLSKTLDSWNTTKPNSLYAPYISAQTLCSLKQVEGAAPFDVVGTIVLSGGQPEPNPKGSGYRVTRPRVTFTIEYANQDSTAKLYPGDSVERFRHSTIGENAFETTLYYNNIAYIDILDCRIDVLNDIKAYGLLENLAMYDKNTSGEGHNYNTQLDEKKRQFVLDKSIAGLGFKYYVAAYNTDEVYVNDIHNAYHDTDVDTKEIAINNATLLNKSKSFSGVPTEKQRILMYSEDLQKLGRLTNSFLFPSNEDPNTGTAFAFDVDIPTSTFSKLYNVIDPACSGFGIYQNKDKTYARYDSAELTSDDLTITWDPVKWGGVDYATAPITAGLFNTYYLYRQHNYISIVDDSMSMTYNSKEISYVGSAGFDSRTIKPIQADYVSAQYLLDGHYTKSAQNLLKKLGSDKYLTAISFTNGTHYGTNSLPIIKYSQYALEMAKHGVKKCRPKSNDYTRLDLLNTAQVRVEDGSEYGKAITDVRGYHTMMTSPYIFNSSVKPVTTAETNNIATEPYIGYDARNKKNVNDAISLPENPALHYYGINPYASLWSETAQNLYTAIKSKSTNLLYTQGQYGTKLATVYDSTKDAAVKSQEFNNGNFASNKSYYINIDDITPVTDSMPTYFASGASTSDTIKVTPHENTLTDDLGAGLSVKSLNVLRNNPNGPMDTGSVVADYRNVIVTTNKLEKFKTTVKGTNLNDLDTSSVKSIGVSPKLAHAYKYVNETYVNPEKSGGKLSYVSIRVPAVTDYSASTTQQSQTNQDLNNLTIHDAAGAAMTISPLNAYIGNFAAGYENFLAKRDQRISVTLKRNTDSIYDERTSYALGSSSYKEATDAHTYYVRDYADKIYLRANQNEPTKPEDLTLKLDENKFSIGTITNNDERTFSATGYSTSNGEFNTGTVYKVSQPGFVKLYMNHPSSGVRTKVAFGVKPGDMFKRGGDKNNVLYRLADSRTNVYYGDVAAYWDNTTIKTKTEGEDAYMDQTHNHPDLDLTGSGKGKPNHLKSNMSYVVDYIDEDTNITTTDEQIGIRGNAADNSMLIRLGTIFESFNYKDREFVLPDVTSFAAVPNISYIKKKTSIPYISAYKYKVYAATGAEYDPVPRYGYSFYLDNHLAYNISNQDFSYYAVDKTGNRIVVAANNINSDYSGRFNLTKIEYVDRILEEDADNPHWSYGSMHYYSKDYESISGWTTLGSSVLPANKERTYRLTFSCNTGSSSIITYAYIETTKALVDNYNGGAGKNGYVYTGLTAEFMSNTERDINSSLVSDKYGDEDLENPHTSGIPVRRGDVFFIQLRRNTSAAEPAPSSITDFASKFFIVEFNNDAWDSTSGFSYNTPNLMTKSGNVEYLGYTTLGGLQELRFYFRAHKDCDIVPNLRTKKWSIASNVKNVIFSQCDTVVASYDTTGSHDIKDTSNWETAMRTQPQLSSISGFKPDSPDITKAYYNSALADQIPVGDEGTAAGGSVKFEFYKYTGKKPTLDTSHPQYVNPFQYLIGTHTLNGSVITQWDDELFTSTNAQAYCGNQKVKINSLLTGDAGDSVIFRENGNVYVSLNKEAYDNGRVFNNTGITSAAGTEYFHPDSIWLSRYKSGASTDINTNFRTTTLTTADSGYHQYKYKYHPSGTFAQGIQDYNPTDMKDKYTSLQYNTALVNMDKTVNAKYDIVNETYDRVNNAAYLTLDDGFRVNIGYDKDSFRNIREAYLTFPFTVYAKEDLSMISKDDTLIEYQPYEHIPIGKSYLEGAPAYNSSNGKTNYDGINTTTDTVLHLEHANSNFTLIGKEEHDTDNKTIVDMDSFKYLLSNKSHFRPISNRTITEDIDDGYNFQYYFWLPIKAGEARNVNPTLHIVTDNAAATNSKSQKLRTNSGYSDHYTEYLGDGYALDLVGRIGGLTANDTGDYRWQDTFKKPTSDNEWVAYGLIHQTTTDPNLIMTDMYDVRGTFHNYYAASGEIQSTENMNTYGLVDYKRAFATSTAADAVTKVRLPFSPAYNIHPGLRTTYPKLGYSTFYSLETVGGYYGQDTQANDIVDNLDSDTTTVNTNNDFGQEKIQIIPIYYDLSIIEGQTPVFKQVDAYMLQNDNNYKVINKNLRYHSLDDVMKTANDNPYMVYTTNNDAEVKIDDTTSVESTMKKINKNLKRQNVRGEEAINSRIAADNWFAEEQFAWGKTYFNEFSELKQLVSKSTHIFYVNSIIDSFATDNTRTNHLLGDSYAIGNGQILYLRARNRTFIGGLPVSMAAIGNKDQLEVTDIASRVNAQKYYFPFSLPSSAKFAYSNYKISSKDDPDDVFIKAREVRKDGTVVRHYIVTKFNIIANGNTWVLQYNTPLANKGLGKTDFQEDDGDNVTVDINDMGYYTDPTKEDLPGGANRNYNEALPEATGEGVPKGAADTTPGSSSHPDTPGDTDPSGSTGVDSPAGGYGHSDAPPGKDMPTTPTGGSTGGTSTGGDIPGIPGSSITPTTPPDLPGTPGSRDTPSTGPDHGTNSSKDTPGGGSDLPSGGNGIYTPEVPGDTPAGGTSTPEIPGTPGSTDTPGGTTPTDVPGTPGGVDIPGGPGFIPDDNNIDDLQSHGTH